MKSSSIKRSAIDEDAPQMIASKTVVKQRPPSSLSIRAQSLPARNNGHADLTLTGRPVGPLLQALDLIEQLSLLPFNCLPVDELHI